VEGVEERAATGRGLGAAALRENGLQHRRVGVREHAFITTGQPRVLGRSQMHGAAIQRNQAQRADDGRQRVIDLFPDRKHRGGDLRRTSVCVDPNCQRLLHPLPLVLFQGTAIGPARPLVRRPRLLYATAQSVGVEDANFCNAALRQLNAQAAQAHCSLRFWASTLPCGYSAPMRRLPR